MSRRSDSSVNLIRIFQVWIFIGLNLHQNKVFCVRNKIDWIFGFWYFQLLKMFHLMSHIQFNYHQNSLIGQFMNYLNHYIRSYFSFFFLLIKQLSYSLDYQIERWIVVEHGIIGVILMNRLLMFLIQELNPMLVYGILIYMHVQLDVLFHIVDLGNPFFLVQNL